MKRLTKLLAWMLPAVVLAGIWFPVLWKYRVSPDIDPAAVERLRTIPPPDRLAELAEFRIGTPSATFADSLAVARSILAGEPIVSERGVYRLSARFSAEDVLGGPPQLALAMSSFAVPDIMLGAYAKSRDPRYLQAAAGYVRDWAAYENSVIFPPGGLFWNDHAIAARALVLTELWLHYRAPGNAAYDPALASRVMELAERYGQLLGRHVLYTYRSNHGTMQNMALMVLALAFPELEHASEWADTGYSRLIEQMQYYIGRDGVISEHSPGYQPFGMELIGTALRCMTLLGRAVPADLAARFEQAKVYYAQLRRPDGTTPMIGDTHPGPTGARLPRWLPAGGYGPLEPFEAGTPAAATLHPDGGILVWWHGLEGWPDPGALTQLAVTWSNWPSRVHKHADEGSLVLWSAGRPWIVNSGYPAQYDGAARKIAEGWTGSNAPHLAGEGMDSQRETRALRHVAGPQLAFFELERTRPDGFAARRQILRHSADLWLVIDSFADSQSREVNTIWTAPPELTAVTAGIPDGFRLSRTGEPAAMDMVFAGSPGQEVTLHRGDRLPPAGWAISDGQGLVPAPAVLVRQRSESGWSVMALTPGGEPWAFVAAPQMVSWSGPDRWSLRLETRSGPIALSRDGTDLRVKSAAGTWDSAAAPVPAPADRPAMEAAYHRAAAAASSAWYGDYIPYRFRATYLVLGLVAGQLLVFGLAWRLAPRCALPLSVLAGLGWIAVGLWLNLIYFA